MRREYDFSNARRGPVVARPVLAAGETSGLGTLTPLESGILEDAERDQYGLWEVGRAVRTHSPHLGDEEVVAEAQAILRKLYIAGHIELLASADQSSPTHSVGHEGALAFIDDVNQFTWPTGEVPEQIAWITATAAARAALANQTS